MPMKPAISALARQTIKTAYDELDHTITPGDKRDFGNTTLQHVQKAALDIENQLAARQSLRNMRRLMPLFRGLEHYSKVIDILCNGTPYLPWIWAPITLVLRIASEYVEAFEQIIKGYSGIAVSLKRFEILGDAFIRDQEFQKTLAVFYADILQFHTHAYKFVRRSGWKLMFLTSWGRFQGRFDNILEDLKQHGALIDKEANARNIAEAKKMREDIRAWRDESQARIGREEIEQSAKQFAAIASWLKISESDQLSIFESISSEAAEHQGTCGWILQNQKVRSWFQRQPDTPALWLRGSAGTGKSVLCTQLVKVMETSNRLVLHHFCTYVYASSTAYEQIIKSLILQLVRRDGDLEAHVYEAYVLEKKSASVTALEQLFQTLLATMSNQPSQVEYAWVVIDGLDECEPDKQTRLIRLINQITSKPSLPGSTTCKVLLSSRAPSNPLQRLQRKQTVSLTDEKDSLHGAIGQYTGQRLRSLDTKIRQLGIGDTEINEIQNAVVEKADGMFLYARLVMDYLASNIFYSGNEIKESVNQLPKELADFYHKILTQILVQLDSRSIDRIRCILGWVAFAKRPLQKLEFLSAITFSLGDPGVDRLVPPYILDICGTLVEERRDSTLGFIHISVKEFLQSSASNIVIRKQEALHEHGRATVACLLSGLRVFASEISQQERYLRVGKGLHGFHVYATEYWTEYLLSHATRFEDFDTTSPQPLIVLACELADEVEISSPKIDLELDAGISQIDERLSSLCKYPTLQKCVARALKARSLKNLETRIQEGYAFQRTSETPTRRIMPEGISALLESYQGVVMSLLGYDQYPGLSGDELELFRAHFGTTAFTCRLGSCPRATLGFGTERLRSEHEMLHVRCFPCTFSGCQCLPFSSAKALRNHTNKYHTPTTARRVIRQTGSRRHGNGLGSSTIAPTSSHHRPLQIVNSTEASDGHSQRQLHGGPLPSMKTLENYGERQQEFAMTAPNGPLPSIRVPQPDPWPFVGTQEINSGSQRDSTITALTVPFEPAQLPQLGSLPPMEMLGHGRNRREQSVITTSSSPENQIVQMADDTHEQQPPDRSPSMERGMVESFLNDQHSQPQGALEASPSESVPFRPMDSLTMEELAERDEIFLCFKSNKVLPPDQELVAAAAFGDLGEVVRLINQGLADLDPAPSSFLDFREPEFSTPILAAIGGPNPRVMSLIITHPDFDPTKGFNGATYAEIAERRRGAHWEHEVEILQTASADYLERHGGEIGAEATSWRKFERRIAVVAQKI